MFPCLALPARLRPAGRRLPAAGCSRPVPPPACPLRPCTTWQLPGSRRSMVPASSRRGFRSAAVVRACAALHGADTAQPASTVTQHTMSCCPAAMPVLVPCCCTAHPCSCRDSSPVVCKHQELWLPAVRCGVGGQRRRCAVAGCARCLAARGRTVAACTAAAPPASQDVREEWSSSWQHRAQVVPVFQGAAAGAAGDESSAAFAAPHLL